MLMLKGLWLFFFLRTVMYFRKFFSIWNRYVPWWIHCVILYVDGTLRIPKQGSWSYAPSTVTVFLHFVWGSWDLLKAAWRSGCEEKVFDSIPKNDEASKNSKWPYLWFNSILSMANKSFGFLSESSPWEAWVLHIFFGVPDPIHSSTEISVFPPLVVPLVRRMLTSV